MSPSFHFNSFLVEKHLGGKKWKFKANLNLTFPNLNILTKNSSRKIFWTMKFDIISNNIMKSLWKSIFGSNKDQKKQKKET